MLAPNPNYFPPREPRPSSFVSMGILIVGTLTLGLTALFVTKSEVRILPPGETPRAVLPSLPRLRVPDFKRRKLRPQ